MTPLNPTQEFLLASQISEIFRLSQAQADLVAQGQVTVDGLQQALANIGVTVSAQTAQALTTLNSAVAAAMLTGVTLGDYVSASTSYPRNPTGTELTTYPGDIRGNRLNSVGAVQPILWNRSLTVWQDAGQAGATKADTDAAMNRANLAFASLGNTLLAQLSTRGQSAGPQFVDGNRWLWAASGAVDSGTVVAALNTGVWVRELAPGQPVTPEMFGAVGNGVTDDSTAVDGAFKAAYRLGRALYLAAKYCINSVHPTGVEVAGSGRLIAGFVQAPGAQFALYLDSDTIVSGLYLHDLSLTGRVVEDGFSEHVHLCGFYGIARFTSRRVDFKAFRGDALHFGGTAFDASGVRHNTDVLVEDCLFDGINKDNRNAISIIDGTDFMIRGNQFQNCTRSNMPGAIDLEPDFFHTQYRHQRITIEKNTATNVGGNAGVFGYSFGADISTLTQQPYDITIRNNKTVSCTNTYALFLLSRSEGSATTTKAMKFRVLGNDLTGAGRPFIITGIRDVQMEDNDIGGTGNGILGNELDVIKHDACDVRFRDNRWGANNATIHLLINTAKQITSDADKFFNGGQVTPSASPNLAAIMLHASGKLTGLTIRRPLTDVSIGAIARVYGGGTPTYSGVSLERGGNTTTPGPIVNTLIGQATKPPDTATTASGASPTAAEFNALLAEFRATKAASVTAGTLV